MKETKNNRRVWLWVALALLAGLALGAGLMAALRPAAQPAAAVPSSAAAISAAPQQPEEQTDAQLYEAAVRDAAFAEEDEILPLVSLTQNDPLVTWDEAGERVLLLTWHNYPDSYPAGADVAISWGTVWTFTPQELYEKYAGEAQTVSDWELRLKQLIGFAPDSQHSTVTAMWVRPEDIKRPAYQTDPAVGGMAAAFPEDADDSFKTWFDGNILSSYYYGAYPWTRLGYTYDWADNGTPYGLTEFLISQDAEVTVEFTESTEEFIQRMARQAQPQNKAA